MLWQLRALKSTDEPFVFSSWLKSHRDSRMVTGVSDTIYYAKYHEMIEEILKDPTTAVRVACDPTDADQIFGYIVGSLAPVPTAYWTYVKHPFRNFGVGKALMADIKPAIHCTLARPTSLIGDSAYNPFAMWKYVK